MRRLNILMFLSMISGIIHAQFVNNGATVTIQSGATLRVETDFINNTGTVTNNGTLEVQGNFTNSATFTSANPSLVKFIGTGTSNVTSGTAVFRNVEMAKTANDVVLASNMSIAGDLNFSTDDNQVTLGAFNLNMLTGATVTSPDANEYIATTGAGSLIKNVVGNSTVLHEIGDASNYTPLSSVVTGTGYSSATLGARVIDATHPNKPAEADSYISRYWNVNATGITTYANTMTGTYASSGDLNGTDTRVKGATYVSPNWFFINAATNVGARTVTGSTSSNTVDFTGMNALNKLNITAYLRGAMPNSGTTMTNDLQTYSPLLLPTVSQYGAPTTTYSDIGNVNGVVGTVTDWVKVEVRNAASPGTVLETRSLLLKPNGSIVDATGAVPYFKDQTVAIRVALTHRNHLSILSNTIAGTFEGKNETYNFSTGLAQASNDFGDPAQMVLKNSVWCMISGDLNNDYSVDANDVPLFFASLNNGDFDVYYNTDLNLDGAVDANDVPLFFAALNAGNYSTLINF
jgi:hypothetical protein